MTVGNTSDGRTGQALVRQVRSNIVAWSAALSRPPRPGSVWHSPMHIGIIGGGSIVATIAIIVLLMFTVDAPAIIAARGLPIAVRTSFAEITDFGKGGWFLWPIGLVLVMLALAPSPRIGRMGMLVTTAMAMRFTFLFAAIAVPGLFSSIVKRLIGRARPFVGGHADPFFYDPTAWSPAFASMPSGHSTTACAVAVAFGALWPKTRPYVWTYAIVICVSRVIVLAHHPSDVLGGAVVGITGALIVRNWFAERRLGFVMSPDGHLPALPGPSLRRVKAVAGRLLGQ